MEHYANCGLDVLVKSRTKLLYHDQLLNEYLRGLALSGCNVTLDNPQQSLDDFMNQQTQTYARHSQRTAPSD
ncbi:F-box domain-containing protein [Aspergillus luchuensis]|uniref:F-box domain-containing protein n=1 Tax=Aspergillus kawachii TaxID=1069201 RepID=A0A146FN21_ASPKA|nr:F-box domain-containing protein [Aspergillus luchuensis]